MEIALYDRMLHAIAECHRVDEVKDLRDKAMALEMYAKQARNDQAERNAADIRIRAERRVGQMLAELQRAAPGDRGQGRPSENHVSSLDVIIPKSEYAQTLEQVGISRQTANRYESLARLPDPSFEAAMRKPEKPTTSGLIKIAEQEKPTPKKIMNPQSLWLWGRIRDLEMDGYLECSAKELIDPMTPAMRDEMERLIDSAIDLLTEIKEYIHVSA